MMIFTAEYGLKLITCWAVSSRLVLKVARVEFVVCCVARNMNDAFSLFKIMNDFYKFSLYYIVQRPGYYF